MNFTKSKLRTLLMLVCATSAQVIAEESNRKNIYIAPQSLVAALQQFSEQTGIQVGYPSDLAQGIQSKTTVEENKPRQALDKLLAGTGLQYRFVNDNTVILQLADDTREGSQAPLGVAQADDWENDQSGNLVSFLEEVIVTATRREASMQDIPMSIVAYSGARIRESGVHDIVDLQSLAAGLHVSNEAGATKVYLRAIGTDQTTTGAESGVAVHRDGVYLAQRAEVGLGFFDVERIEVLRGPQGTLYGRNATGGALNIISKSPTPEFEAGGSITTGNYNLVETEGYVSGPLTEDKLTARCVFKTRDQDGYTLNIHNGEAYDNDEFAGVRAILRYEPTKNFRVDLSADYAHDNGIPATVYIRNRTNEPLPVELLGSVLPSDRAVNLNNENLNEKEAWGLSAKVLWEMEGVIVSSLTAFREYHNLSSADWDGGNVSRLYMDNLRVSTDQFSQEVTLTSADIGLFEWVLGGFYFHSNENSNLNIYVPLQIKIATDNYTTDAYAVFGETSYPVLDRLTLTLGARYSYKKKSIAGSIGIPDFFVVTPHSLDGDDWGSFTPKAALTYAISKNVSLYATVGKGFKSGSYNGPDGNPLGAYNPEKAINYELGFKGTFLEGRLRANGAAFYMDYTDLQVEVDRLNPVTGSFEPVIQNAAEASIQGVELELQSQFTETLSFDVNASYLDAVFSNWPDALDVTRGGAAFDVKDNRLPNAPEWVVNVAAAYTVPVGTWNATFRGEYSYKSRVFFSPFEDRFVSQAGVGLLNTSLAFNDAEGGWSISVWARNLTNEEVAVEKNIASATFGKILLAPRTYGVSLAYKL